MRIDKNGREVIDLDGDDKLVAAQWLLDAHEMYRGDHGRFLQQVRGTVEKACLNGTPATITVKQLNYLKSLMRQKPGRRTF